MSLLSAMATVAGLTGLSRIAGFFRDVLTASILGAGPAADAFFVALKLPNFFRRVTAEGAFSVSFVPLYSEALEKEDEEKANAFAGNAFTVMLLILGVFTALAMIFMPQVIRLIAPGFTGDEIRYPLAVELSRVTFPYLLLMSLTALLGGVLNAHGRFGPFAVAPVLFNLSLIGALLFLAPILETAGHAMAWGVATAGVLQLLLLWISVKRAKLTIPIPRLEIKEEKLKRLFILMGPGVIGAGVMHINLFADLIIGSFLEPGSIAHLYYADRLNQLPLGVIGIALGTALLPVLSRTVAAGETEKAKGLFNQAMTLCCLLSFPAAVGLLALSLPVVGVLFERGAFDRADSLVTASVLMAYAIGMPAYTAVKVWSAACWARQDTVTPVKISVATTLFNIGCSLYFIFAMDMGAVGIALATSLAGWLQAGIMAFVLRNREEARFTGQFLRNLIKIMAACALMGTVVVSGSTLIGPERALSGLTETAFLGALVLGGALVYSVSILMIDVIKIKYRKFYLNI